MDRLDTRTATAVPLNPHLPASDPRRRSSRLGFVLADRFATEAPLSLPTTPDILPRRIAYGLP